MRFPAYSRFHGISAAALACALLPVGAARAQEGAADTAQAGENAESGDEDGAEIVVTATRLRGQVDTNVPPIVELEERDIAAYGATSIADLLDQLTPQTGSGRGRGGRPVILLNGQRIANFREMGRFPPEAIRKVEVLPEEVAVRFGYPPDARVVNIILKDNFASRELELDVGMPTGGGHSALEAEASLLRIAGPRRFNAALEYARTSPLTEAERAIIQPAPRAPALPDSPDTAEYRTLISRSEQVEGNLTVTQGLGDEGMGGQLALNGNLSHQVTRGLSGLEQIVLTAPGGAALLRTLDTDPLARRTNTDNAAFGAGLNTRLGTWQLSSTLDTAMSWSETRSDRRRDSGALVAAAANGLLAIDGPLPALEPAGYDDARSRTYTVDALTTLVGQPLTLPAGPMGLTLAAGLRLNGINSRDSRNSLGETKLDRRRVEGSANLAIPLASAREGFLGALGELSLDLGGGVENLSDFGTLIGWNGGLTWRPAERLSLQASYRVREIAPSLTNLGAPAITQFNLPLYDFVRGETVLASVTSGGNPALLAETQRDWKLAASYDIDLFDRANVIVEYYHNSSDDTTESFPVLTPAIEAAFPGRVTRAGDGTLLALDRRPVTFAERRASRLRYGFNLFGRFGTASAPSAARGEGRGPGSLTNATPAPEQVGPGTVAAPGAGMRFDPVRFAELRARFCATPEGQMPDLTGVPEEMVARLRGADGQIDPARVAILRQRFCTGDGAPRAFDPAAFAALRRTLACGIEGGVPDIASLPAAVADRVKGPDGQVDPARLAALRERVCAADPARMAAAPTPAPAPTQGGSGAPRGGMMGGMFGGPGDGQGRFNVSLYHTVELGNRVLIAPGLPELDLLAGDAVGSGGVSRHRVELEGGAFRDGLGARLSGAYASPTRLRGSGLPGSSDLRFGGLATINLRLFANLEQQRWLVGEEAGWLKGTRLSLRVDNLFDSYQRVTDGSGTVPLSYQPGLIDPRGRFIELELRKLF